MCDFPEQLLLLGILEGYGVIRLFGVSLNRFLECFYLVFKLLLPCHEFGALLVRFDLVAQLLDLEVLLPLLLLLSGLQSDHASMLCRCLCVRIHAIGLSVVSLLLLSTCLYGSCSHTTLGGVPEHAVERVLVGSFL